MANNRIFLRCKACGEELPLGKRFLDGYFYNCNHPTDLYYRLSNFYHKHTFCNDNGPDCFEISYAYEPEFEEEEKE